MPAHSNYRVQEAVSAGGVVHRPGSIGLEVLLLETANGIWGLPKGTPDAGETMVETARREVCEETGLQVVVEDKIGTIEYWFARAEEQTRYHKHVHFWLMRPVGGDLSLHDDEHISVEWVHLAEALRRVTHATSAETLQRAADLLSERAASPESRSRRP
jgi:8-oxo-dGTP pyrophosphatase MutT (NUDIX family)